MTMNGILEPREAPLADWLKARSYPEYRIQQIRAALYGHRVESWDDMTSLPKRMRAELAESFSLWTTRIAAHRQARDGTEKLLLELSDGGRTECVLLPGRARWSLCISTQVVCA